MNSLKILSIAVLFMTVASGCATTIVAGDDNDTTSAPHANNGTQTNLSDNYVIQQSTRDESGLKSGSANDTTVKEIQISK